MKRTLMVVVVLALGVSACAVKTQKQRINDARLAIAATGIALEATDKASAEYFEEFPAENTDKYCEGERIALVLKTVQASLVTAAEGVKLWEVSLTTYLMRKDGSIEQPGDWDAILASDSQWMEQAVAIVALLDMGMEFTKLSGQKVPKELSYAWGFLRGLTGKEKAPEPDVNWKSLESGVCADYVPGGE